MIPVSVNLVLTNNGKRVSSKILSVKKYLYTTYITSPSFLLALGTKNDNFVRCPKSALEWRTRRFRMLEEIARHDADIICLQV